MKNILLLAVIFTTQCQYTQKLEHHVAETCSEVKLSIVVNTKNEIVLIIENTNPTVKYFVTKSDCWLALDIFVYDKEKMIEKKLKIKPNPECLSEFQDLGGTQQKSFVFPYKMTDMYLLESNKTYRCVVDYKGGRYKKEIRDDNLCLEPLSYAFEFVIK